MIYKDYFKNYSISIKNLLDEVDTNLIDKSVELINLSNQNNNKIYIVGNGGSASIASHVSVDFAKVAKIPSATFNNANLITCFANDYGYPNWVKESIKSYCNNNDLSRDFEKHAKIANDPLWRLPLYEPYRRMLDSKVADISSASEGGFGGGITAALFLQEFVEKGIPWAHFDIMAWNTFSRAGRPEGGEAQSIRAAFNLIVEKYGS